MQTFLRNKNLLTQRDLANILHVSTSCYCKYENNIIDIPYELNTYKDLAEYTFLYGATNDLPAGTYKIVIVSPATPEHGRRQTTINIKITE